ncbi:DUF1642 domain-containing protein [Lacticaseibacillus paracasei]|uniref:DUF1642 domain-containing protein n=1 Tax=Lacticaseibacillus paracasei TaxID=1597 RepID=UPI00034386A0|nr:DUF1642 domain-containing protein [Lacticaseibacillus paracasei]EPC26437.1 hypothetical protein Lpp17_1012 [Lacticaseibacillus paracasei subsp. paracasei Lpp17]
MTWYVITKDEPGHIKQIGEEADRATTSKHHAEQLVKTYGGHIVELIEKPNPEVVSKAEAKMLDKAKTASYPANYISMNAHPDPGANGTSYEELRLMRALVNGYTVAKKKKYLVYKTLGGKQEHEQFAQAYRSSVYPGTVSWILTNEVTNRSFAQFTEAEIEHYGLQDCEKEEVTDDAD